MADETHGHEDHHEATAAHGHHVVPIRDFAIVYVLLLAGLIVTYLAALVDLGPLNSLIAMGIAVGKALMVVLIFMNVRNGTRLQWLWASAGFVWLLLLFITVGDYMTRGWGKVHGW